MQAWQVKLYDACAGPHLGTESLEQYLKASIDIPHTLEDPTYSSYADGLREKDNIKTSGNMETDYINALKSLPNPDKGLMGLKYTS